MTKQIFLLASFVSVISLLVFAADEPKCSIRGTVTDPAGSIVSSAGVSLASFSSGAVTRTTTTETGAFQFPNVPCGEYIIHIMVAGFKDASQTIALVPSAAAMVTIQLQLARSTETISVSSGDGVGGEEEPFRVHPEWNAWQESTTPDEKPNFTPESVLQPNTDYTLNIDLASFSYGAETAGLFSQKTGPDALKLLHKYKGRVRLDIVVIPDPLAFEAQTDSERHGYIDIDVGRIRAATQRNFKMKKSPLEVLKKKPDSAFVFGRFRTRVTTGSKKGSAGIAVSIWKNGTPIDEFSIPVCVSSTSDHNCKAEQVNSFSLEGNTVGALAAGIPRPSAALHFVQTDSSHLFGVFHCNICSSEADRGFKSWEMKATVDELSKYLSATIVEELNKAVNHEPATRDSDYIKSGESLYMEIFRDPSTGGIVPVADSFKRFVDDPALVSQPNGPSLFVRFLPARPGPLLLFPVGLMVIPGTDTVLASKLRIEIPLENQIYSKPKNCIDQWSLMVPDPANEDTMSKEVNEAFKVWNSRFQGWNHHASVYNGDANMGSFEEWISRGNPIKKPTAVLLISNQKNNKMYFNGFSETPWIDSNHIMREFAAPSIAILAGCGTAGLGQAEFVRQFNLRGMAAVIATSYRVSPRMTGLFVAKMMENMDKNHLNDAYTLSNAVYDAMLQVRDLPKFPGEKETFGPRAFAFMLAGNGELRVCVPTP